MSTDIPYPRDVYEGNGGWKDGRLGQAYDLICEVLKERNGSTHAYRDPLLLKIELLDEE